MTTIIRRPATEQEKQQSLQWDLWESGDTDRFEYSYDQNVQFVVQSGEAVIHSPNNTPVAIGPGDHVTIGRGVEGRWAISSPIINRYQYI
ncbi:cupin domain-containing protein [Pseudomonas asplenii]|uniref:cupin domain-containing protein n=1 Tax=Pseudomonas asplenii TaxID=53407 RepID=UPI0003656274|nr:cupin domain-containing protein [Pseudomonas fuscovaginae]